MSSIKTFHEKKLKFIALLFFVAFLISIVLLGWWQLFDNEKFILIANDRFREIKIPSVRGSILASDGSTLAYSEPRFDAYVWLPELEFAEDHGFQTRTEFIQKVALETNQSEEDVLKKLNSGPQWIKVAKKITAKQRDSLLNLRQESDEGRYLQGLQLEYVNQRIYPENRLASHVIGFVGLDNRSQPIGVGGLEQRWDGSLKPFEGFESGEYDSFGNPITLNAQTKLQAKEGVTIYTTIDKSIQQAVEIKLKEQVERFQAKSGTVIILDPHTGKIIALANYPDYDPNEYFKEENGDVFGNLAVSVPYEIGSIGKVMTLAAALDSGSLTPDTMILPHGHDGCEIISPNPKPDDTCVDFANNPDVDCICTWNQKPQAPMNVIDAFVGSDNIAFRHIAMTMDYKTFYEYLNEFGIGRLSGIDIAGESTGLLKSYNDWNYADQAVYSYGHSYQATPLQAISAIAAMANNGERMQPYIVSKVDSHDEIKVYNPRKMSEVTSPTTATQVSEIMHQVYLHQLIEHKYKYLSKYYIAMKSGTALIPYKDRAGYSSEINASYVGFDASPEHKFIMLVKLEEPQVGDLSYYNARIAWLEIFIDVKEYLGIPEYTK